MKIEPIILHTALLADAEYIDNFFENCKNKWDIPEGRAERSAGTAEAVGRSRVCVASERVGWDQAAKAASRNMGNISLGVWQGSLTANGI